MITLIEYPRAFGTNTSAFSFKVELAFKLLGIPFEVNENWVEALQSGLLPKGKVPVIIDEGVVIHDSTFILDHIEKKYGKSLNKNLSEYEKAMYYFVKKTLEENWFWYEMYAAWADPRNLQYTIDCYFGKDAKEEDYQWAIDKAQRDLKGTGHGLHSVEDIEKLGLKDVKALEVLIKNKKGKFIFGDECTEVDVLIYSFLIPLITPFSELKSGIKDAVFSSKIIMDYIHFLDKHFNENLFERYNAEHAAKSK